MSASIEVNENAVAEPSEEADEDSALSIDFNVHNVMCNFSTGCHLNLKYIARCSWNVCYEDERNVRLPLLLCTFTELASLLQIITIIGH